MPLNIRKNFAKAVLKLTGWKTVINLPDEKKFVIIGAPHTSNWDLPMAILVAWSCSLKLTWMAKKQIFTGPWYYLFTLLGGIPVDRESPRHIVDQVVDQFARKDEMVLGITPEGTRSFTNFWKTGFYRIALQANVPLCFGFIDYSRRTIGFAPGLKPSGDMQKDFEKIAHFYADKHGKYPEKQGPVRARVNNGREA